MNKLSISQRVALLLASFVTCIALVGAWAYLAFERNRINGPLYEELAQRKALLAQVLQPLLAHRAVSRAQPNAAQTHAVHAQGLHRPPSE